MKRQHIIFLAALAAFLGSIVTTLATYQEKSFQLRGYVNAAQDADIPYRLPRFGINTNLEQYIPSELIEQLDRMTQINVSWVRQSFRWDEIEPVEGQYKWEQWDRIVETVAAYPDINLIAVLVNTPQWARTSLSLHNPTTPPAEPAQFATFARAFAERYSDQVDYYQIWDEPNLEAAWGQIEPRASEYVALLSAGYEAIHTTDPGAQVIAAALAPTTETGPDNISDLIYLSDMYALGAAAYMDAAASKPYGFNHPPDNRTIDTATLNFSRIIALREIMVNNDDAKKPLWAMNWGWNSLPSDWEGRPSIWGSVTSEQQAGYTLDALYRAEVEWPWLAGMVLHTWQPNAAFDDPVWGFSLVDQRNAPTPLWQALHERPTTNTAANGLYPAVNPYARYSGVWTFGELGADIGWVNDSQLEFDFSGQAISLLLRQDNYVAHIYPTVDAQPPDALPRDASGNAYIVLTSGSNKPEMQLVPLTQNLQPHPHTLHVIADKGWDRWALAGYAVSSTDLAAPYDNQIAIGWLATLIALTATAASGWSINWRCLIHPLARLNQHINASSQVIIGAITSIALLIGMMLTWGDGTPSILRREPAQLVLAILTAGLMYIEPGFLLTVIATLLLFIVIYNRLDLGLALTIFWSPFFLFPVELYRFAFPMAELILLLTALAGFLKFLANRGRWRQTTISQFPIASPHSLFQQLKLLDYAVLAWVGLGLLSLLWTQYRSPALTELRVLFLEPAIFYIIFRVTIREQKQAVFIVDALLMAGLR